jgi:hypothetical protein
LKIAEHTYVYGKDGHYYVSRSDTGGSRTLGRFAVLQDALKAHANAWLQVPIHGRGHDAWLSFCSDGRPLGEGTLKTWRTRRLEEFVNRLPEPQQRVMILLEGIHGESRHNPDQIARALGISIERVQEIERLATRTMNGLLNKEEMMDNEASMDDEARTVSTTGQPLDDVPDDELLDLLRVLIRNDPTLAEKMSELRLSRVNVRHVEMIGSLMLQVPELRGLASKWPEYNTPTNKNLEKRVSAIEETNLFTSLLDWLAGRLWDLPAEDIECSATDGAIHADKGDARGPLAQNPALSDSVAGLPGSDSTGAGVIEPETPVGQKRFCDAASDLLDAADFAMSPWHEIWKRLTGERSNSGRVTLALERIEVAQADTREATEEEFRRKGWALDPLTRDTLEAVDEVLEGDVNIPEDLSST